MRMSSTEVAAALHVSERTIQRWIKQGRLEVTPIEHTHLFEVTEEAIERARPRPRFPEAPDTDARFTALEARIPALEQLEARLSDLERSVQELARRVDELRRSPAPAPAPPTRTSPREQKMTQAKPTVSAAGDTLPGDYTPVADVIREYGLESKRKSIHRHMSHLFKPGGPWVVGGRKIEAALDEEGVQAVLKFVGIT
jgi:hypothetical protein